MLGQPYWGSRIASALDGRSDIEARFIHQGAYPQVLARPPRARDLVLVRAGYRVGATTLRGRLFDAYWSMLRRRMPHARGCHYWLGTDVMDTLAESRAGTLRRRAVDMARADLHITTAPWLAVELQELGYNAEVVHVPQPYEAPAVPSPMPETFRVLTYLPGDRFAFYGGEVVLEAARRLPDITFDVVGPPGPAERPVQPNVTWHGWVAGMNDLYARAAAVVRIPRHDGLGHTVVEALLHGRQVIYSYRLPFVRTLEPVTADGLVAELAALHDAHRAGSLELNLEGRAYALEAYDPDRLVARLAALIGGRA